MWLVLETRMVLRDADTHHWETTTATTKNASDSFAKEEAHSHPNNPNSSAN
jgi:hypothetical protein